MCTQRYIDKETQQDKRGQVHKEIRVTTEWWTSCIHSGWSLVKDYADLSFILVFISLSLTTSPTSRALIALCTFVTSAASYVCLTLELPPPLLPPSFTPNSITACNSLFLTLESTQIKHLQLI